MRERVYLLEGNAELEPLDSSPFESEDLLQELVADHPEIVDGEQIDPENPRRWIVVGRELGIADSPDGADRWSLDHLLLDQDGIPTLVEVKRGSDSRIRRQVVGQMLDYAAHAPRVWSADGLRQIFEGGNPDDHTRLLCELLQDDDVDPDEFWTRVSLNLEARHLRLLFIADRIPDELARIVEFLNEQMRIAVLAVELKQFRNASTRTLVPRVLGRYAATRQNRNSRKELTNEEFLGKINNANYRKAAARLVQAAVDAGGICSGSRILAIKVRCPLWRNRISVAWLTPSGNAHDPLSSSNNFLFGVFPAWKREALPRALLDRLEQWCRVFESSKDFTEVSNPWGNTSQIDWSGTPCYAIPYAAAVQQIDFIADRLGEVVGDLVNLSSSD